ncbi:MAG: hypothetical protein JWP97_6348 [Labilithrix sp.]|nr:hypothetical protein [Labilithrix sp.]
MGTASWQPKWWSEEHTSTWGTVKEALKRDWEQTKADLHMGGKDLDQNVTDTVKQASGKEAIPGPSTPNATHGATAGTRPGLSWDEAEQPLMYGYGARKQYGTEYNQWDDKLESRLRTDWETDHDTAGGKARRAWDDVKTVVRHGYDRART